MELGLESGAELERARDITMKVYELFQQPGINWIQNDLSLDGKGHEVFYNDPSACCFCLIGGISKCYQSTTSTYSRMWKRSFDHVKKIGYESVAEWNDDPKRTKEDVVALCKELDI